jgi:hypothetical protein
VSFLKIIHGDDQTSRYGMKQEITNFCSFDGRHLGRSVSPTEMTPIVAILCLLSTHISSLCDHGDAKFLLTDRVDQFPKLNVEV